ncbi:13096_t:CDS:2, partial [Acaulospora colombiana]
RINEKEEEMVQAGALYALYTLFQLQNNASGMQKVAHIEIALDTLEYLVSYAKASGESVRHHLLYILHSLFSKGIFHVLPASTLPTLRRPTPEEAEQRQRKIEPVARN